MTRTPELPAVALEPADIAAFWRDGVVCVRQLYSAQWRARLAEALSDVALGRGPGMARLAKDGDYSEAHTWLTNDILRDFVLDGPSAWIAQQLFGSKTVNFYFDQVFIKNRLSPNPTPWHHDFTFWPLKGDQILSLWTSLDPVDAESSALEFVAGSHRWPQRFQAIAADGSDFSTEKGLTPLPDIDGERERYSVLSWALEPGDALVFHALTLHGARGNSSSSTQRRAITTRWCGDDVTFAPRVSPMPYPHGLNVGDKLGGPFFPRVCPTVDEEAVAGRMQGIILPDPQLLEESIRKVALAKQAAQSPATAA